MQCQTCRELMMPYLKDELGDDDRNAVAAHLDQCVECRKELEGVRRVLSVMDAADEPAIRELVQDIIARAIQPGCSDIHLQPMTDRTVVRYRIDGVLHDERTLPKAQHAPVVTRLKYMAGVNTMETQCPQDGRARIQISGREYDLRISCLPTAQGESIVIRLLSPLEALPDLDAIGMSEHNRALFDKMLHSPCGVVIVCGPTGSGKTTTLYAALLELNRREVSIHTVEDPVEILIDGINQIRVNPSAGVNFATAMRHILRQDPDVIMCGELRNLESVQTAVSAALTGHLVLTTLHTADAAGVLRRLADVGLERFLIADAVLGALGQRLVRNLCPDCRQQRPPTPAECAWLQGAGVEDIPDRLWGAVGCNNCRGTGYRGRSAVHEVLVLDEELRQMLTDGTDMDYIERMAAHQVQPLRYDAAQKVLAGVTDVAEAARVFRHISARDD